MAEQSTREGIKADQGEFQKTLLDFMITPFLKIPRRGDVEHLGEVNRYPPCESHKPCMKMKKIFYLTILRLLIRGPNGVNCVCKPCEPPNFAYKIPTSAITKDNSKQSIRIK